MEAATHFQGSGVLSRDRARRHLRLWSLPHLWGLEFCRHHVLPPWQWLCMGQEVGEYRSPRKERARETSADLKGTVSL